METNKLVNHNELSLPPGDMDLDKQFFAEHRQDFMKIFYDKYGEICKTKFRGTKYIYMQGYQAVKFVITNENKYFKSKTFSNGKRIFGETNIGLLTGKEHIERQKLLTKALKNKALENYIDIIENLSQNYLGKWATSNCVDLYSELNHFTLDLTLQLLLGINDDSQREINQYLMEMRSGLTASVPLALPWTKLGQALQSKKKLFDHIKKIISERQKNQEFGSDVLGIILAVQQEDTEYKLSLKELIEQMINLFSLGKKELSSALTSFFLLTAEQSEVLDKLKTEQEKLDRSVPVSFDKLKKMVYLEQVIKEVLRQAPPVAAGLREVVKDCSFNGYKIPKGWNVVYQITSVLEDPKIYDKPEKFNPDRFNSVTAEDRKKPLCYLPFGGGARECIGKEFAYLVMKIFLSELINTYRWEFKENQDLTINKFPVAMPANKVEVSITKV